MTAESALLWMVDFAIKGVVLLALAMAIIGSMRRASAAARHMIWTLAMIAALLLPGLSVALPQWQVSILPGSLFGPEPLANFVAEGTLEQRNATIRYFGALIGLGNAGWAPASLIDDSSAMSSGPRGHRHHLPLTILTVWLIGAGLAMLPWLAGAWTVWRLGRGARRVRDSFINSMFHGLRGEFSIRRKVELKVGRCSMTPMAWGVFRPCVLLPPEALRWPADRLRSVLLHELAHVKRWDCLTQLLGQLACAIYWFNPMAWLGARAMRAEHERACDDRVLAWGLGEACYAEHLVQVARSLRAPAMPWMAAVAMARQSQLRDRLLAILDPSRPRTRFSGRTVLIAVLLTLALVSPLAMLHGANPAAHAPPTTLPADQASSLPNVSALLVTEGNYYLERLFQSMPPMALRAVAPGEYEQSGPGDAALVIFDRYTPARTPAVPCIFFAAAAPEGPTRAREALRTDLRMEAVYPDHPITRSLNLSTVYVRESLSLDVPLASKVLVNGDGEPMIVLDAQGNRQMIVAFDVQQSNWPLRTSFPIFMYRAVESLLASPETKGDVR